MYVLTEDHSKRFYIQCRGLYAIVLAKTLAWLHTDTRLTIPSIGSGVLL